MAPPSLSSIAADLLGAAVAALGTDAPDRRFVSHNAPAWDLCKWDQLTVHLASLQFKQSAGPRLRMTAPNPTWAIQIVRCVPQMEDNGHPPSADALSTSGQALLDDLDAIQQAVRADAAAIFGGCEALAFGQAVPLGPQGGVGGYSWPISAEVTGVT